MHRTISNLQQRLFARFLRVLLVSSLICDGRAMRTQRLYIPGAYMTSDYVTNAYIRYKQEGNYYFLSSFRVLHEFS